MKKSDKTREKILDAAVEIFAKKGFNGASTLEISKAAKCAEGTIFRYYPKKKDLLHGIVMRIVEVYAGKKVMESIKSVIEENRDQDLDVFLKNVIKERLEFIRGNMNLIKVVIYEVNFHEDIKEVLESVARRNFEEAIGIIVPIIRSKVDTCDLTDIQIFKMFISCVAGFVVQNMVFSGLGYSGGDMEDDMDFAIRMFINGIRRD